MTLAPSVIRWGASTALERGPIVAGSDACAARNAIGVHAGAFAVYRALAVATGSLSARHRAELSNTEPSVAIGPFSQWADAEKIVTFDPWGHLVTTVFAEARRAGQDIRPSIAVADGRLSMAEIKIAMSRGALKSDGRILRRSGDIRVTKIAIEPVWWLPGVAARLGVTERRLREQLCSATDGMYPALTTDFDRKVFLPPIGGTSVYLIGDVGKLIDPSVTIACRIHDECSGSDVFGSDICSCRPYLAFGVEEAVRMAQQGGLGVVVYNRKEGRALGEVIKLLVYNARARGAGGDRADSYFERTQHVAGVADMRFQSLAVDVLHWLGIRRIHRWVSMSNHKAQALQSQGIEIVQQVALPEEIIPARAGVEIRAKRAAGYYSGASQTQSTS